MKKKKTKDTPKILEEWLYLAAGESVLRRLYECLKEKDCWKPELWEEAGVLEIGILDAGSIDLEVLEEEAWDEEISSLMKEQGADQIFSVVFTQEDQKKAQQAMEYLVRHAGGVFCRDCEDFLPEITTKKEQGEDR